MDGDPVVEPQLDAFSLFLPLPYRVAIIIVAGVWAWGANLHYLNLVKIDVPALIRYPARPSPTHPSHHLSTYRLATILTIPLATSLVLFWLFTRGYASAVIAWSILPNIYLLILIIILIIPLPNIYGYHLALSGRSRLLGTLRRISIGGLAEAQDGKFGDILLADALTSYAKVLGDLFVSLCMFFNRRSSTSKPDRSCGGTVLVPFILAVPSLIRLRQCLIEYVRVRKANEKGGAASNGNGWGGQHLANALKYSSAFPVVLFSAMQRNYEVGKWELSEMGLYRLWLISVTINSLYSFYWDVAKDWDLGLFSSLLSHPSKPTDYPWGLRRHRFFHSNNLYYVVIVLDFFLRFTWSIKLSPHLDHFNDLEGGIFMMELLEVFRRWLWIFFRVETEWVRNSRGPAPDDVLLGEFAASGSKYDED